MEEESQGKEKETENSSPFPSPELLRGYEDIIPGAADRLLAMAEKEQQYRHDLEMRTLKAEQLAQRVGLLSEVPSLPSSG